MTAPLRAWTYARVSTTNQAIEGTSLDTQQQQTADFVHAKKWTHVEHVVDKGISGAKDTRPGLDKIMQACRDGHVDVIVVAKLDRFSRSMLHLVNAMAELNDLGVSFVSVSESIDSTTRYGKMQMSMVGTFAEFERDRIVERMMESHRKVVADGFWRGGPAPYGYKIIPASDDPNHSHLAIRDDEAGVFHLVADLLVNRGMSRYAAAIYLNAEGIRTQKGCMWTGTNLSGHLRNPHLTGTWTYDKDGDPIEMNIPAIFTDEEWNVLQAAIKGRPRQQQRHRSYALTGRGGRSHLRCNCGGNFYGKTDSAKTFSTYVCSGNPQEFGSHRCPHKPRSIRTGRIEQAVLDQLRPALSREYLLNLADTYLSHQGDDGEDVKRYQKIERRISELNGDKTRLARKLAQNDELDFLEEAIDEIVTEVTALLEQRNELDQRRQLRLRRSTVEDQLQALADVAQKRLDNLTTEELAEVVDLERVGDHKFVGTASIPIPENGGEVWEEGPRHPSLRRR